MKEVVTTFTIHAVTAGDIEQALSMHPEYDKRARLIRVNESVESFVGGSREIRQYELTFELREPYRDSPSP